MIKKIVCVSLAMASFSLSAAIKPYPNDYVYFSLGNVGFDTPDFGETSIQPSFGLGWGHNFSQHFAVEGLFRYSESEIDNSADNAEVSLSYYTFGLSGLASTGPLFDTPFSLYGRASGLYTIANLYSDGARDGNESGVLFNIGGGIQWDIGDNFWVKGEYLISVADTGLSDFYNSYDGIQLSIGKNF